MAENDKQKSAQKDKKSEAGKASKSPGKFAGFAAKTAKFFRDCKGEIKKIVWPTPQATFKSSGVVLAVVAVVCVFVFLLDSTFMTLLGKIMNIAG